MPKAAQRKTAHALPFIFAALCLVSLLPLSACKERIAAKGQEAPGFSVIAADGSHLKLSDLKGNVVFVNFWATWCPPCREETPSLSSLYRHLEGNPRFRYVSIIFKDDPAQARSWLAASGLSLPVYADPDGKAAERYGLTGVPETYIIDKKGILREKVIGPMDWESPDVLAFINNLTLE